MAKNSKLDYNYKIIFEILEKDRNIDQIVRDIAAEFHVSIVIMDPLGKSLAEAYTSLTAEEEISLERQTWTQMIEKYYEKEIYNEIYEDRPALVEHTEQEIKVMKSIIVQNGLEGFCITYHNCDAGDNKACELNHLICRAIAVAFGRQENIYTGIRQIISRLLLDKEVDLEHMPKLSEKAFDLYALSPFLLALINIDEETQINEGLLRVKINEYFPNTLICFRQKEITVLFGEVDSEEEQRSIYAFFEKLVQKKHCICGLSEVFYDRGQIKTKQKVLERLIWLETRMHQQTGLYTEYENYMELICSYAYEAIGAESYCSERLKVLEHEDMEKGTELCLCLKEYLMSGNNVNYAAKKLFIHRNTMVYRLSKITEIIKLDINNPEIAKRLMLSMILRGFLSGADDFNEKNGE